MCTWFSKDVALLSLIVIVLQSVQFFCICLVVYCFKVLVIIVVIVRRANQRVDPRGRVVAAKDIRTVCTRS